MSALQPGVTPGLRPRPLPGTSRRPEPVSRRAGAASLGTTARRPAPRPGPGATSTSRRFARPRSRLPHTLSRRSRLGLAVIAAVLVGVGALAVVVALRAQREAPQPPPAAAGTYGLSQQPASPSAGATSGAAASQGSTVGPAVTGPILARSLPVRLKIPKLGVNESLITLGLNKDNTVEVPPLSAHSVPGWYRYSPTPGTLGPSVILGHVDSAKYGPGVFFKLGSLRKGDMVEVTLAEHQVAEFRIDAVASYPKTKFPTQTVYGNTDHAALRLITCGGDFDSSSHNYLNNIVAFASLVGSKKA